MNEAKALCSASARWRQAALINEKKKKEEPNRGSSFEPFIAYLFPIPISYAKSNERVKTPPGDPNRGRRDGGRRGGSALIQCK
jgi:hypothetical protein